MSTNAVGIICEYDPFHLGHAYQFSEIKKQIPGVRIVCLMSGCFTQRGAAALYMPHDRAEAAVRFGADIVYELPVCWSIRDAQHFALAGVSVLNKLSYVKYISFGCEDSLEILQDIADYTLNWEECFRNDIYSGLKNGKSYAASYGEAMRKHYDFSKDEQPPWEKPNNILAICYLQAIRKLKSDLIPLPVIRSGSHSDSDLSTGRLPSSSAIRMAIADGKNKIADEFAGYSLPRNPICFQERLNLIKLYNLRSSDAEALRALPECSEGLENRVLKMARASSEYQEMLEKLKTKRYTMARLNRLCIQSVIAEGIDIWTDYPEYIRLIAARCGSPCLNETSHDIQIISKAAQNDSSSPFYRAEMNAWRLWEFAAGIPQGSIISQRVRIIPDFD